MVPTLPRTLAAVMLLAACAGCTDPVGPRQDPLSAARARWASAQIEDYTFVLRRLCFCGPDFTSPLRIEVVAGAIHSAEYVESGEPFAGDLASLLTIDGLFDEIQDAIDRDAHSLEVEYDEVLGYPADIWIDYSLNIADEEQGFIVSLFQVSE